MLRFLWITSFFAQAVAKEELFSPQNRHAQKQKQACDRGNSHPVSHEIVSTQSLVVFNVIFIKELLMKKKARHLVLSANTSC